MVEEDRQGLLAQNGNNQNNNVESDYIDFEAPEVQEEVLPIVTASRSLGKQQRIVLKYPDGSLGQGKGLTEIANVSRILTDYDAFMSLGSRRSNGSSDGVSGSEVSNEQSAAQAL